MKTALCIRTEDFVKLAQELDGNVTLRDIRGLPTTLEDRATCETDPSLLQLLPYASVETVGKNLVPRILTYRRPFTGAEGRLFGAMSIGFGGHVDTAPDGISLFEHLHNELGREMKEELGLTILQTPESREHFAKSRLVYDTGNDVGHHHLGIFIRMTPSDFEDFTVVPEELEIESPMERTLNELLTVNYHELESWSQIFVTQIVDAQTDAA